jgi:hypothetical protein
MGGRQKLSNPGVMEALGERVSAGVSVTDVYDRHSYADEDRRIMAAVARPVRPFRANKRLPLRSGYS